MYNLNISIPASSIGNEYTFLLFAYPEFDTKISDRLTSNDMFYRAKITQPGKTIVRFCTSSDQTDASFVGVGTYTNTVAHDSSAMSNIIMDISNYTIKDTGDGLSLGYKWTLPSDADARNTLNDDLQPQDGDFYTKVTTQTDGSGTDSTSMIVDSVDNLVIGMSLVSIADSSDLEQSGTLGVLTYPTITAIDSGSKTLTLSAAPDWGDDKAVVFRAYGSDLISKSTGAAFSFDLKVTPTGSDGALNAIDNYGKITVNGDVSGSTSIAIDNISGVSVGSKIIGAEVSQTSNANLITAVHASGTPITVTGNQTLADNTKLSVYGSSSYARIDGAISVKQFPAADTDVYYDIDRAFILATNS